MRRCSCERYEIAFKLNYFSCLAYNAKEKEKEKRNKVVEVEIEIIIGVVISVTKINKM